MLTKDRIARLLALSVVLVSAVIMGYILLQLSETKENFALQVMNQSAERIEGELDMFFGPIENMILTVKKQQETHSIRNSGPESLNGYFIPIIEHYSQISSIGIADSRGYEFNVLPDSVNGSWLNREVFVDEWGMTERWSRFSHSDRLTGITQWESDLQTDPRRRSWFTGALDGRGDLIHWTEPYIYMTGELGLTSSIEWRDSDEPGIRQILALDVTLTDITRFSQSLSLTENNQVFILTNESRNIIGLPQNYSGLSSEELMGKLMSSPEEFGNRQLVDLLNQSNGEIVNFVSENKRWWGILKPYSINSNRELLIAILLPESDFAGRINATRNAVISGFIIILIMSILLVRKYNHTRRIRGELAKKNLQITRQKERLFSEVHHRVKNNLAVMSALLEMENLESNNPAVKEMVAQTQGRIRAMSAVHEILYKSDDMNRVEVSEFIPGILDFSLKEKLNGEAKLSRSIEPVHINVNQALSYALLVNEFFSTLLRTHPSLTGTVRFEVHRHDGRMVTKIRIANGTDIMNRERDVGRQLIDVLITQLEAELHTSNEDDETVYEISFTLRNRKGITGNRSYAGEAESGSDE
jgi:two-component sensor histidine kinase